MNLVRLLIVFEVKRFNATLSINCLRTSFELKASIAFPEDVQCAGNLDPAA
jgi:hypothetical protein